MNNWVDKRWNYIPVPKTKSIKSLSKSLNINPYLTALLLQRGIDEFDTAKQFFRPSLRNLHNPFLMKDMDKAVERLNTAFKNQEKILIYGDYDVDGTTSVSLVYRYIKRFYTSCSYYIPDRLKEGYGISKSSIIWASKNGFSLILALDLGIKAADVIAFAQEKTIDFIICDHHLPHDCLPKGVAILNPKRKDCTYPFKELSGCGIGFKLIQALTKTNGQDPSLVDNIDLVAVSIASDIVPINGENRILAYHGLIKLNHNPLQGLKALKEVSGMTGDIDISHIVFKLAPRINAAGRVAHAQEAVELLITDDKKKAIELAKNLDSRNKLRQDWDSKTTREALSMITTNPLHKHTKSTVLYKKEWKKGVVGIVASRCIEKHYKPTIILTQSNGIITGSGRSIQGFNLYKAILKCSDLLEQFGGHKYAIGLTLKEQNLETFKNRFNDIVSSALNENMLIPTINVAMEVPLDAITKKFMSILKQMAPFGPEHQNPVFVAKHVFSTSSPSCIKGKHIQFIAQQKNKNMKIKTIGFNMATYYSSIKQKKYFDLAFTIEENKFKGNTSIKLKIRDIKFE